MLFRSLHDDPPTTQRVISTRWVCFLPLSPSTTTHPPPNVSSRHVGCVFCPSPLHDDPPPPNVSSRHVGWVSCPIPLDNGSNDHPTCHSDALGGFLALLPSTTTSTASTTTHLPRMGSGKAAMEITGPNDAMCVVWTFGEFFIFVLCFFTY